LEELPLSLRVVFVLRDVEGFSIEQTAEVLELTHAAVKARSWRARLRLRERLSKYFAVGTSRPAVEKSQKAGASKERPAPHPKQWMNFAKTTVGQPTNP
jgi:hypothetical protein